MVRKRHIYAIARAALIVALVAVFLYVVRSPASSPATGQPDPFTLGTAIVVAGYVAFPALLLLGLGMPLVALALLAAHAIERRRAGP